MKVRSETMQIRDLASYAVTSRTDLHHESLGLGRPREDGGDRCTGEIHPCHPNHGPSGVSAILGAKPG